MARSELYLIGAGRQTILPGELYPPVPHSTPVLYHFNWRDGRILPEFSIILIARGSGTFESRETGLIKIDEGTGMFLFPGVWHRYCPNPSTGWSEKWIQFSGTFPHRLVEQSIINPKSPVFRPFAPRILNDTMDSLLARVHCDPSSNTPELSFHAMSVLTLALSDPLPGRAREDTVARDPIVEAALDHIWSCGDPVLSVEAVVKATGVVRRRLERRMRAARGHSVLDEIIHCRFSRAARLLRETELPIKTVVALAGFGSAENLRHVFLCRTKLSPSEYRRQARRGGKRV